MKDVNITKVAEIIGIEADKAWNIFRKIQRKANKLYKKLKADNIELLFTLEQISKDSNDVQILFQKDSSSIYKDPENLVSKLTEIQINKINSIYSESSPDKPLTK